MLDELSPRDGNAAPEGSGRLVVNAQIKGVDISFAANLVGTGIRRRPGVLPGGPAAGRALLAAAGPATAPMSAPR
ncbi:MAG: hypothetical protein MZV65_52245 [Chromatiales bacterium]|nr:hypothetical protein [Chromatiales bacterium]